MRIVLVLLICYFLPGLESQAKILSPVQSLLKSESSIELYGKKLNTTLNPFSAFLESMDGVRFDLDAKLIKSKKSEKVVISIPVINRAGIFKLRTSGGDIKDTSTQDFYVFIGTSNDSDLELENLSQDSYIFNSAYDTGFEKFGFSTGNDTVLQGAKGDTGEKGETGDQGEKGDTGATGNTGTYTGGTVANAVSFSGTTSFGSSFSLATGAAESKLMISDATGLASWQNGVDCTDDLDGLSDVVYRNDNLYIGNSAGSSSTATAARNIAYHQNALVDNTTGSDNIAFGNNALRYATGSYNIGLGTNTFFSLATGDDNIALGYSAGSGLSGTLNKNTLVGPYSTVTSASNASENVTLGAYSLKTGSNSHGNTALGGATFYNTTTSNSYNTVIGFEGLSYSSGSLNNNVAIGLSAGRSSSNASNNILIGDSNTLSVATATYTLDILDVIYGGLTANKKVGIGTSNPARNLHVNGTMRLSAKTTAPLSPVLGDIYVDSNSGELCFYNGSAWIGLKAAGVCA